VNVAKIYVSLAISQASVYTTKPQVQGPVHHVVCLLLPPQTKQCLKINATHRIVPQRDGQAEFAWVDGYISR